MLSSTDLHEDGWLKLEGHQVIRPDGSTGAYNIVRMRKLGVGVLPIDADGCVMMIGQWRLPLGHYSWEMPEGGCEAGEEPLDAAKRELREEAGLTAARWIKALDLDLSTTLTDERSVSFIAFDLDAGPAQPEGREVIQRRRAPFIEVLERIDSGEVREAMTVATILRAAHLARSGALPAPLSNAMLRA